jgi:hypothetical protein
LAQSATAAICASKAGFRHGDTAAMAVIEFVDVSAKGAATCPAEAEGVTPKPSAWRLTSL